MVTAAVKPWFIACGSQTDDLENTILSKEVVGFVLLKKICERELNKTNKMVNFG